MSHRQFLAADIASVRAQYSGDPAAAPEGTPIGTDGYVRFLSSLLEQRDRHFAPGSEPLQDPLISFPPVPEDIDRLMAPLRTAVQAVREEAGRIEAAGGFGMEPGLSEFLERLNRKQEEHNRRAARAQAELGEHKAAMLAYLEQHDANGDGTIQPEEAEAVVAAMGNDPHSEQGRVWVDKFSNGSLEQAAGLLATAQPGMQAATRELKQSKALIGPLVEEWDRRAAVHGRLADKPELLAKVEAALEYIASGEMAGQFRLAGEQAEQGLAALAASCQLDMASLPEPAEFELPQEYTLTETSEVWRPDPAGGPGIMVSSSSCTTHL